MALEMVRKHDTVEGTVIITNEQTKGRGQRGNQWSSSAGENLTLSLILNPRFLKVPEQFYLNKIISLAVFSSVHDLVPDCDCLIKWPNDILIANKKVAGILIENNVKGSTLESSVVGIGLNVNQLNFGILNATSLASSSGKEFNLEAVFEKLILNIESYYLKLKSGRLDEIKQEYLQSLYGYKVPIRLREEYEFMGEIVDVESSGHLIVSAKRKVHRFDFKEVEFLL